MYMQCILLHTISITHHTFYASTYAHKVYKYIHMHRSMDTYVHPHCTWDGFEHVGYECVHDALVEEMVTGGNVADELLALAQGHQLWQGEGLHILILAIATERSDIIRNNQLCIKLHPKHVSLLTRSPSCSPYMYTHT